ncbi:hypothetical protein HZS_5006 [Henneguya salminicola]|nr:hypothetical protein HZS_5006 [Henneguya salminicola]
MGSSPQIFYSFMPPKRRLIGQSTTLATKKIALRSSETDEQGERRLLRNPLRNAQSRISESDEQREERLEAVRIRIAKPVHPKQLSNVKQD